MQFLSQFCWLPQELCRFLSFAALKETYFDCPEALDDGMRLVASDLDNLMRHGLELRFGEALETFRLGVTGVKGDWPWLIEAGHLCRHFRRAPKRGESTMEAGGVCHLCLGGVRDFPFEDFGSSPSFEATMYSAAASWLKYSSNGSWLFRFDHATEILRHKLLGTLSLLSGRCCQVRQACLVGYFARTSSTTGI